MAIEVCSFVSLKAAVSLSLEGLTIHVHVNCFRLLLGRCNTIVSVNERRKCLIKGATLCRGQRVGRRRSGRRGSDAGFPGGKFSTRACWCVCVGRGLRRGRLTVRVPEAGEVTQVESYRKEWI